MMVFCTLFDSNYLDKAIVMYKSLVKTGAEFKLYVLAMDDKCFDILSKLDYPHIKIIDLSTFIETLHLQEIKKNRSAAEFCWTCSSYLILYILTKYQELECTYIDSDLYFFSDPQCIIDEMGRQSVQIIEHGFCKGFESRWKEAKVGKYCVEFNTFKSTEESLELLRWWANQCSQSCCLSDKSSGTWGDQKYMENWGSYSFVNVVSNKGAGLAPWNINRFRYVKDENDTIVVQEKESKENLNLIFYHFHKITYIDKRKVDINVFENLWNVDKVLIDKIYYPYLEKIDRVKNMLNEEFNIYPYLVKHPGLAERKNMVSNFLTILGDFNSSELFIKFWLFINEKARKVLQKHNDIITLD